MTGNKTRLIEAYLSNNHRFVKTDPLYRKVSLLNALLSIMLLNCSVFVVVDIFFFKMYTAAAINAAALSLPWRHCSTSARPIGTSRLPRSPLLSC